MNRTLAIILLCIFSAACPAPSTFAATQIGNFHYKAQNGIAFIKDDSAGFVINPGGSFNAGTVAPDDSFHSVLFATGPKGELFTSGRRFEFQWSRQGDVVVGRIISDKPGELTFSLEENWPGFSSEFSADKNGVVGVAHPASGGDVTWKLQTSPAPKSMDGKQFTIALNGPNQPVYMVAGFGPLPSFEGIDEKIAAAKNHYESWRPSVHCPSGDILAAIADNLNNSRMYASDNKRIAISVSRTFGVQGPNLAPYFCWDSFFSALLTSIESPEMARETVRAIFSGQTPEGLVPNYCHWNCNGSSSSDDRSQPPVGSLCVWKMHQRNPDVDFLKAVSPKLELWHSWWMKARNAKRDGLLEWGSSTQKLHAALLETGWDDTPHFGGVKDVQMEGDTMNVYAVDLCALWAMDAHYLALIADALGKKEEAKTYRNEERDMNARINAKLWNEKLGIYCSRFWDKSDGQPGDFLTRLSPANFYPLISGAPNPEQARRVLAVMTDPAQFWGDWILPTLSKQDPLFFQQRYWCGTVWGPVNYLVFQGLKRYAPPQIQADFAQKSVRLFMNSWQATGQCGELFSGINGQIAGNKNYTWGALLCLIGVESVVDIEDSGEIKLGPGYNESVDLNRIPIGGKPTSASIRLSSPKARRQSRSGMLNQSLP